MANFAVTAALLFFLLTLSYARHPPHLRENIVASRDVTNPSLDSDTDPVILLPTEERNPVESRPQNTKFQPFHVRGHPFERDDVLPVIDFAEVRLIQRDRPLKTVTFRPINRHFPPKRSFPFRIPQRSACGGHPESKGRRVQISYGDDMILSSEYKDLVSMVPGHNIRRAPVMRVRSQSHHHHLDEDWRPRFWSKRYDRSFNEEKPKESHDRKERHHQGGLLMRFRKFLAGY